MIGTAFTSPPPTSQPQISTQSPKAATLPQNVAQPQITIPNTQPSAVTKPNPVVTGFLNTPVPSNALKVFPTPSASNPGQPLFQSTPAVSHATNFFGQSLQKPTTGGAFSFGGGGGSVLGTGQATPGVFKLTSTAEKPASVAEGRPSNAQQPTQTALPGVTAQVAPPSGITKLEPRAGEKAS